MLPKTDRTGEDRLLSSRKRTVWWGLTNVAFAAGLFLPFLHARAYSREYCPPQHLGWEWLYSGTVQNVREMARGLAPHQRVRSRGARHVVLVLSSAVLLVPISLMFVGRRRPLWLSSISLIGLIGVVGLFAYESPSLSLRYVGSGFITWIFSAALALGLSIRIVDWEGPEESARTQN